MSKDQFSIIQLEIGNPHSDKEPEAILQSLLINQKHVKISIESIIDIFVRSKIRSRPHALSAHLFMDYRFKPISKTCAGTGKPLVPGEVCYSVLVEKNGGMERLDFSEEGWTGIPGGGVGFWKSLTPEVVPKQVSTTDPETLMSYFEEVVEDSNPQQEKISYVLALYLLQRRRLKLDGSVERDGSEYLLLSGSRGEGPYEVRDQQLPQEEIAELQSFLNQQLTSEWNAA